MKGESNSSDVFHKLFTALSAVLRSKLSRSVSLMLAKLLGQQLPLAEVLVGPLDLHATTLRTGSKYEVQDIQADLWPVPCIALGVQHRISEPSITVHCCDHNPLGCSGRFHSPSAAAPLWFESVIFAPLLIQLAFSRYLRAPNAISVIDLFMCARPSQLRMYLVNCCLSDPVMQASTPLLRNCVDVGRQCSEAALL